MKVAFRPERVAEGNALDELRHLPNIVGADEVEAGDRAEALFARLGGATVRTTVREAELAKLFTNAWRYLKFAIANQFLVMSNAAGADQGHVLEAIRTGYPRASDVPSPGFAAGPCLLKDTMQLAALAADHFALGHAAVQANEGMPAFVVGTLQRRYGALQGRTVGVLGMSFKPEPDDIRSSLSYKLRKLLTWTGARVLCTDSYVNDPRLVPLERVLAEANVLVLGVPRRAYLELDLSGREVVDIRGPSGRACVSDGSSVQPKAIGAISLYGVMSERSVLSFRKGVAWTLASLGGIGPEACRSFVRGQPERGSTT